jgi:uncharacterized damage-inducible protein DinB
MAANLCTAGNLSDFREVKYNPPIPTHLYNPARGVLSMPSSQISELTDLLRKSYAETQELLSGTNPNLVVFEDPEWRVRDIIWHLAAWDRQVTQSIEAFEVGGQYSIPDFDEDGFNEAAINEGRELPLDQVLKESHHARTEFQRVVGRFPGDQLETAFLYPWGDERGDIAKLVNYMVEHDAEHRAEISATAAKAG